jgi:CubicO group peptidase (beta-lactamase class C family)
MHGPSAEIARQAKPLVDGGLAPTLAVGLYDDGATCFWGHEADEKSVFEIGSITKVFTGILLAGLVRDGALAFDDPVAKHLPASVRVPAFEGRAITLDDLVTHMSGLPRLPTNLSPADKKDPYADYTVERLYAFLTAHELARAPGAKHEYSNLGYMLLGHALSQCAGKSYAALLEERIAAPLAMADTKTAMTPELRARFAKGYDSNGDAATHWQMGLPGPGNLLSTAEDMLRFLAANVEASASPLSAVMADARAPRRDLAPPAPAPIGALAIGCGWVVGHGGVRWHNGGTGGYVSFAGVNVEKRKAVVALCGTFSTKVDELGYNLLRVLDGETPEPPRVPVPVAIDAATLAAYAGRYALPSGGVLTVREKDGRLLARRNTEEELPMYAASETRFFFRVAPLELTFVRGDSGEVVHAMGHVAPGIELVAKRLPPE